MPGRSRWRPLERALHDAGHAVVAGVDEVGRGPLAGPVVACAIVMPTGGRRLAGVDDSKRLSASDRASLLPRILGAALTAGLGAASVREIDGLDIRRATALAMRRALARLATPADHVLVDGLPVPELGERQTAVVGGDGCCYSIACASIVAKEVRDRLMRRLAVRHPAYAWDRNAGYGTPAHLAALAAHGATRHHRRTFAPVAQCALI